MVKLINNIRIHNAFCDAKQRYAVPASEICLAENKWTNVHIYELSNRLVSSENDFSTCGFGLIPDGSSVR